MSQTTRYEESVINIIFHPLKNDNQWIIIHPVTFIQLIVTKSLRKQKKWFICKSYQKDFHKRTPCVNIELGFIWKLLFWRNYLTDDFIVDQSVKRAIYLVHGPINVSEEKQIKSEHHYTALIKDTISQNFMYDHISNTINLNRKDIYHLKCLDIWWYVH